MQRQEIEASAPDTGLGAAASHAEHAASLITYLRKLAASMTFLCRAVLKSVFNLTLIACLVAEILNYL